jgi:hypothetical protein
MEHENKIENEILESVRCTELSELGKIAAETGLDSILSTGLMRDIPIINTFASLIKAGMQISDRVFAKKIIKFLHKLAELPENDRRKMVDRLNSEEEYRNRVGERLIEILDRVESHRKPEIIAKIFCAYVQNKIAFSMLRKFIFSVERIPYYEIENLREFQHKCSEKAQDISNYIDVDLLVSSGFASPISAWDGMQYKPTKLCQAFLSLDFDRD